MSTQGATRPGWFILLRDVILFALGTWVIMKQAGLLMPEPKGGPSIELIILGGLLCNGPVMLQALALRFGTGGQSPLPPQQGPGSQQAPSSAPSSGGDG